MPVFEYEARTKDGQTQSGKVDALSESTAIEILQGHGLIVTQLQATEKEAIYKRRISFFERVSKKELSIFFRQLATLFKASVPLVSSVRTLSEQVTKNKLKQALLSMASDIDGGMSFSQAMQRHEDVFTNFYAQMVRAGEESGNLDDVLGYLADYTERDAEISSKIKGAMTYPAFILGVFSIVGLGMMIFVVPNLLGVLGNTGTELPWITRVIAFISDTLRSSWHILIGGLFSFAFGFYRFKKTEIGKELWGKWQLKIPVFGKLFKNIYLFRFSSSLGMLVKGGVHINTSLEITANVIDNEVYKAIVVEARDRVSKGETISKALSRHPEISGMVIQMLSVGEKTGSLSEILENVSSFYEREVSTAIDTMVSLIEPILIVTMGIGVSFLVAGIMLPIYDSINSF